jgi:vacuolar-type H+-ATPase subunit I/STV1
MKRLTALAPLSARRSVIRSLTRFGCVEIESCANPAAADSQDLLHAREENTGAARNRERLAQAVDYLNRYSPQKTSMFSARPAMTEKQLFDPTRLERALGAAQEVVSLGSAVDDAKSHLGRLASRIAQFEPWKSLEIPLNYEGSDSVAFVMAPSRRKTPMPTLSRRSETLSRRPR